MSAPRFYRRRFLNKRGHHAGAYVIASIEFERSYRDDGHDVVDAHLTIADCGRVATLDFDAYTTAEARNSLYKARLLRIVVDGFVDSLERAIAEADLRTRR